MNTIINKQMPNTLPEISINDLSVSELHLQVINLNELESQSNGMIRKPHRADFFQLLLVAGGTGTVKVDSQKYSLKPQSLFALSNGQVSLLSLDKNVSGYAVFFSPDFIYKYSEDLQWISDLSLFDPLTSCHFIELSEVEYYEMLSITKKIIFELNNSNKFAKDEILFNLLKIIIILAERLKRSKKSDDRRDCVDAAYITAFRNKLEGDYYHNRMVKYYADYLNITAKKLNQVIYNFYGKPVKQLIEERVLLEIKRLLIHTDKTIKEIGISLGFKDPTNFNKYVKKYLNITPADFRALYK
mgnify:CR=1 FL=1